MKRFDRDTEGRLTAAADGDEIAVIQTLAAQVADLVTSGTQADPAITRLLPDAYRDDAEASAEFRRFTTGALTERKVRNATAVIRSLDDAANSGIITLDGEAVQAWLRTLTDIRLTIAVRLNIATEDDEAGSDIDPMMRDIYDWLGFIQNSLVEALDA
ncbi:MAG: hypothetical protein JWP30_265 [Homoserinimonas sp.]|nr:hypothetical protein [Homoserinimonas sp.]